MAESIMRKIQPFTIGTKLSVPSVPKCPDFAETYLPSQTLDNCKLQQNLNDQVSLYLGSQMHPDGPRFSPVATQVTQVERQEEMTKGDHLNRNAVSPTAFSRSIRKITITRSTDPPGDTTDPAGGCPKAPGTSMSENINNNNNIPSKPLPRIVGVSCENKPNSHFKVLLKKDATVSKDGQGASGFDCPGDRTTPSFQTPVQRALSPKQDLLKVESPSSGLTDGPSINDSSFTQRNAVFNREILQAEAWIKEKLQDLKDGCNVQKCPLQEWEELSQTLQRDLKDFENTLIQLNQMGEQLMCKLNPTSDLVKKQLSQLKDQWHALKQTAANQSKALGGARNLQEFNRKVDKLEAWIKEKEEDQSLVKVLGENIDKMQLTRRILDLKQDEQLYRTLHEEINHLALKLEKQGRTEGKNISTRRKHVNKMWLKVQSLLKDYHENLQLALEVSSFYQQADNIICAINNKRKSVSVTNDQENSGDREIRDIASQIMMLDVTVSQLSNLHPALALRVTQKQAEVKDGWALLQKAVRTEKPALPVSSSDFTREDGDPLTPSREAQCSVGIETHRIMGKEVKEEQNRLKGCVSVRDFGNNRKSTSSQDVELNHTPSVTGNNPTHTGDVTARRQTGVESRKQSTQSKPAVPRGHPQLHVQLQKFTVSADKTLSWLKDNVAMATQICCTASLDGFEAAKRCQAALEEEILSNRARIEVVKKEGRSLVRAQHPGSTKIEEFLGQLEFLWEELKRRHQKNVLVLQESEKLNLKATKVLRDLSGLEAWLQTVELSIQRSSLAKDPESMSVAEQESSLLEREVSSRGLELRILRQEVDKLRSHRHFHTQQLMARMGEVEEKYHSVQSALTQQSSELQDTRMLTEFLERVELEESQELRGGRYGGLGQTFHTELSSSTSLLGLQGAGNGGGGGVPLMESIGDPVEELREAVEMLNDTVRERGRSLSQEQGIQELLSRHSSLTVRITRHLSRSAELNVEILDAETDMAVKCEPDLCGLERLQDQQDELEVDCDVIKEEVEEMEKLAARLEVLCPERVQVLRAEVQVTLQAWEELGRNVAENHTRLRQFVQLRDFFRNYLAMISWTEDTRACIFSESTVLHGTGSEEPKATQLDMKIEQKFREFDDLAAAGQKLINEEHHLTEMIRERMEELRSMLGWILVRWRAQKHQKSSGKRKPEPKGDVIYSEATVCTPSQQNVSYQSESQKTAEQPISEDTQRKPAGQPTAQPGRHDDGRDEPQTEGGYEVMGSVGPRGGDVSSPGGALQGLLAVETPASPFLVLKEPSAPSLGGTVNLILSFGKTGDSQLQVEDPAEEAELMEPIHRVSTYLHVKDNNRTVAPVCESVTLPSLDSKVQAPASSSSPSSSSSSSSSSSTPRGSSVSFHTLPRSSSSSIFSSLKRRSKKRKRKRDVRRHTIQRIMGVEQPDGLTVVDDRVTCSTNTWPLKERKKKDSQSDSPTNTMLLDYVKNPLAKDIDAECSSGAPSADHVKNCRYLSLGSVLSFDLPTDSSLIPSIPDVITICPPEPAGRDNLKYATDLHSPTNQYPPTERHTALSTFRQAHSPTASSTHRLKLNPLVQREVSFKIDCHGSQKVHVDSSAVTGQWPPPPSPILLQTTLGDDLSDLELSDLSGISGLHEEVSREWDKLAAVLDSGGQLHSQSSCALKEEDHCKTADRDSSSSASSVAHVCPSVHTRVQDLHGHEYRPPVKKLSTCDQDSLANTRTASRFILDLHTSVRGTYADSEGVTLRTEESPDIPRSRRTVGRAVPLESLAYNGASAEPETSAATGDIIHPDHQQFEEEEEELEDIWNQTSSYPQSICSDIMYQTHQAELASTPPGHAREPSPQDGGVLYRKLVTASAPNLLVAEFMLPASVQALLGYRKEQCSEDDSNHTKPDRKSWAAFPNREPPGRQITLVNETASDLVKLPDIEDQQKYIYQYKEEEEEEEEVEGVEVEAEVDTGCPKAQSMSLLSVHMGLEGAGQPPVGLDIPDSEEQGHTAPTGGHCSAMNGRRPEFQSMEGTLERKHRLQLGGKKAPCRAWNTYHAVLFRQTLCFYQDRKDTLKSSVSGMPLNLIGAECSPAPEYTKKTNCFSLRLRDGSEYLLSASSRFLMKKWMLKIQANAEFSESSSSLSGPCAQEALNTAGCHCGTKCHCHSGLDATSPLSGRSQTGTAKAKEIVVLTRDSTQIPQWHYGNLEDVSPAISSDAGHCEDYYSSLRQAMKQRLSQRPPGVHPPSFNSQESPSSKRRSHSFTSATYQKITPVPLLPGGREGGSSYSVTLVIGDQHSEATPSSNSTEPPRLIGWRQEHFPDTPLERSYASLPRPRNKSVFKKFFGKKE